ISSSLPAPFWTEQTAPPFAKARAVSAMAASVNMLLTATMPKSQGGSSCASDVARTFPTSSSAPTIGRPRSLITRTCASSRSYAQTSTSSTWASAAANSDPTAPQPTTQTLIRAPPGPCDTVLQRSWISCVRRLPGLDQAVHGGVQRHRNAHARGLADERAGDEVDLRRSARPDVLQHRRHVRVGAGGGLGLTATDG